MEQIKYNFNKLKVSKNTNIHSEIHALTDEISKAFNEPQFFGRYLGAIKKMGPQKARQLFEEIKRKDYKNPAAMFFWKYKKRPVDKSA